jgi:hypothetical protein
MNRRIFLQAAALLAPALAISFRADASTSRMVTLDELLDRSTYVVIATPGERRSLWEDLPSGKRIVTYTRVAIERPVDGAPGTELWVRTLGGAVDKLGQAVPGEAQLAPGARAMMFLVNVGGVVVVTGMAQGHFPIVADDKGVQRLVSSPDTGMLLPRNGPSISAREQLVGAALEDAVALVKQMRKARNEKR